MLQKKRREFIKNVAIASVGFAVYPNGIFARQTVQKPPLVTLVKNGSAEQMVQKALEPLGSMSAFVKKGQTVIVKPNMSWDRRPEQGANTNPEIVAAVVKLALATGAGQVRVFDRTCNEKRRCYRHSGIAEAAEKAGAKVYHVIDRRFKNIKVPDGKKITRWEVYEDLLDADVCINVPALKHHSLSRISGGIKNIMGFLGGDRGKIHRNFDEKIIDFATIIKPNLTILDATRVLMRNGPQGGNLADVKKMDTLIASVDMVAVDVLAASLMDIPTRQLGFLLEAERRGLGVIDVDKLKIQRIDLTAQSG